MFQLISRESKKRHWRDDRRVIQEISRSLSLMSDLGSLMASITERLKERFQSDRIIILRATDAGFFTVTFSVGYDADDLKSICLSQHDRLPRWLLVNETPLSVARDTQIINYLSKGELEMLRRLNVRVCLPLLVMKRLTGIMFLSSNNRKWRLSRDDFMLLQVLTSHASVAFENANLYQQQKNKLHSLYRTEKLATTGHLAASVAHEVRNPLTCIRSTAQYLLDEFEENPPKRELIECLVAEVDRINGTIDGLLSLTRNGDFVPERIALLEIIKQVILLAQAQGSRQSIDIALRASKREFYAMGDVSQVKQLFLNVVLNAFQAMPDGGRLEIDLDEMSESVGLSAQKNWVRIVFRDFGCGIVAENLEKIFDPFFTTKQKGTGLGLSICLAIAQQHGGEIEIQSELNGGTAVSITLPSIA